MSAFDFKSLLEHVGHSIQVVTYGDETTVFNVAVECTDCNTVLLDYDNPDVNISNDVVLKPRP